MSQNEVQMFKAFLMEERCYSRYIAMYMVGNYEDIDEWLLRIPHDEVFKMVPKYVTNGNELPEWEYTARKWDALRRWIWFRRQELRNPKSK